MCFYSTFLVTSLVVTFADCCREYERASDPKKAPTELGHKVLKCINDPRYIEHDAYFLFDFIMLNMWEWYFVTEAVPSATPTVINGARAKTNVISVEATEQRLFSGDNRGDEGILCTLRHRSIAYTESCNLLQIFAAPRSAFNGCGTTYWELTTRNCTITSTRTLCCQPRLAPTGQSCCFRGSLKATSSCGMPS